MTQYQVTYDKGPENIHDFWYINDPIELTNNNILLSETRWK